MTVRPSTSCEPDQPPSDEGRAERWVSRLRIASWRRKFREAGYFEPAPMAARKSVGDGVVVAAVAPGVSQADELRDWLVRIVEMIRAGELGPAAARGGTHGIEVLLAALVPDGDEPRSGTRQR